MSRSERAGDPDPAAESEHDGATGSDEHDADAFAVLGNEVRTAALSALADADGPLSFTELFEASPAGESSGFAYHLRKLDGRFVENGEDGDGYRLTYAGRRVVRALRAGTYTERADFGPVDVGDPCPVCGAGGLEARCLDNDVTVACTDCGRAILSLPLPPAGTRANDPEAALAALDRRHRSRLSLMADGVCPDCSGRTDAGLDRPPEGIRDGLPGDGERARVRLRCRECDVEVDCPVTLALLDHPAVVAFYHDHGLDVRERPIWNAGGEWSEAVLSTDPWCVRATPRLEGEALSLLVGRDLTVVRVERTAA